MHRAKRALPGMVVTLILSAPLCGHAWGAATPEGLGAAGRDRSSHVKASPKVGSTGHRQPTRHDGIPAKRPVEAKASTARIRNAGAKPRGPVPYSIPLANGAVIHRASLHGTGGTIDRTLIDDGTLWRERGSVATWQQTGMASWYGGSRWQGHMTSSGSRYNQNELTAAHATLPLGTKVRVVRHDGRRSVIVTINDRPGTRSRIIDLSREAAKELGILDTGVAMVTLQPM